MRPTFLLIFRQPGQNGGEWYPKWHAVGDDYIGSHPSWCPIKSSGRRRSVDNFESRSWHLSWYKLHLQQRCPTEQKMTSYVCFAQRSHHSIAFLVKYTDKRFIDPYNLSIIIDGTKKPYSTSKMYATGCFGPGEWEVLPRCGMSLYPMDSPKKTSPDLLPTIVMTC